MLHYFATALGASPELRAKLRARVEADREERARRQAEHEALVARFLEKPDEALLGAQAKLSDFPLDVQEKFKTLTKHQQLSLVALNGSLEDTIVSFLAVPVDLRAKALELAQNSAFCKSFKKTPSQIFRMFR